MKTYHILVSHFSKVRVALGELLHRATSLELKRLSDAAEKGAVWHQKNGKGKILRIRSLDVLLNTDDKIIFYYDPKILSFKELTFAHCAYDVPNYSIWIKPAGVLPQGTQFSDHTCLLRYVEKFKKKQVFLIHRLDRETEGPMVIGHTPQAAAKLGDLFQKNKVTKNYQAIVKGQLELGLKQTINKFLDEKAAITHFEVIESKNDLSLLSIKIDTGRFHQIRRHLDFVGLPIMGDPKYGKGNKNTSGLQLIAKSLKFIDPWSDLEVEVILDKPLHL